MTTSMQLFEELIKRKMPELVPMLQGKNEGGTGYLNGNLNTAWYFFSVGYIVGGA